MDNKILELLKAKAQEDTLIKTSLYALTSAVVNILREREAKNG